MKVNFFFVPRAKVHGDGEAFDALSDFLKTRFARDGVGGVGEEEVGGVGGEGVEKNGVVLAKNATRGRREERLD